MSHRAAETLKTACITVLWSGFMRPAPATWGSLVAIIIFGAFWWVLERFGIGRWAVEGVLLLGVVLSSAHSVLWGPWAIARFQSKDPRNFVLDEFAGQWLSLLLMPIAFSSGLWSFACVVGGQFVLFRIMDVLKPAPAFQLQRLRAGWGILVDDLVAGVYANIAGQVVWRLTPLAAWLEVALGWH